MITTKQSQTVKNILIAASALVGAIALTVCITIAIMHSPRGASTAVPNTSVQDWVGNQQTYPGEKNTDSISIPGFDFLNLKAGAENQAVNFYNPPANSCYFKISIILNDKTLWQSPLLAPGKAVYNIEMNQALKIGEYHATLKYECFSDMEATKALNGSEIAVVLKALK